MFEGFRNFFGGGQKEAKASSPSEDEASHRDVLSEAIALKDALYDKLFLEHLGKNFTAVGEFAGTLSRLTEAIKGGKVADVHEAMWLLADMSATKFISGRKLNDEDIAGLNKWAENWIVKVEKFLSQSTENEMPEGKGKVLEFRKK